MHDQMRNLLLCAHLNCTMRANKQHAGQFFNAHQKESTTNACSAVGEGELGHVDSAT
jgi:hypothetical protein